MKPKWTLLGPLVNNQSQYELNQMDPYGYRTMPTLITHRVWGWPLIFSLPFKMYLAADPHLEKDRSGDDHKLRFQLQKFPLKNICSKI